jgi:hypothetical protein
MSSRLPSWDQISSRGTHLGLGYPAGRHSGTRISSRPPSWDHDIQRTVIMGQGYPAGCHPGTRISSSCHPGKRTSSNLSSWNQYIEKMPSWEHDIKQSSILGSVHLGDIKAAILGQGYPAGCHLGTGDIRKMPSWD